MRALSINVNEPEALLTIDTILIRNDQISKVQYFGFIEKKIIAKLRFYVSLMMIIIKSIGLNDSS